MLSETNKVVPWPAKLDLKNQAVEVPGSKKPGQTGHYRSAAFGLISLDTPHALRTVSEIFEVGLKASRNKRCLGHRPVVSTNPLKFADQYVWETYASVDERRRAIGSALTTMFQDGVLKGREYNTVGLWSINRPEWQLVDIASQTYGTVGVALYDTLGKDSVEYIINHAHVSIIFAAANHIPTLLKLAPRLPCLKMVVSMDDLNLETRNIVTAWGASVGVTVKDLRDIIAEGKAKPIDPPTITPQHLATIMYTSGTTGNPKGVCLTHGNIASAVQANLFGAAIPDKAVVFSYLPLAHVYQRLAELTAMTVGGGIGYYTGDPLRLLGDCQLLNPHFFVSVPRVLNRIYQAVMAAGDAPGLKGALFRKAVAAKLERLHTTGDNTHPFWDRLVFNKAKSAILGSNLVLLSSGAAPISPDVIDMMKILFGCEVVEGPYGMTENTATATRCLPFDPSSSGTVGVPQPCCELKLVDVPAMGYTAEDKPFPRGEICVRGANVFREYYRDEKNTKETLDPEGWIHTGDVGLFDECNRLKIIDRVKNIMKLAQGEYVALEKIESVYSTCPIIAQLYVHGDSLQTYLVGVVVPDPIQLASLCASVLKKHVAPEDLVELSAAVKNPAIVNAIVSQMVKEAKKNSLKGFETIKRVLVTMEPFTVDNGTMTPTLKLRRKEAYAMYKSEIEGMYALGEPSPSQPIAKL